MPNILALDISSTWLGWCYLQDDLLAAGVRASVFQWPKHTPLKADIGWLLSEETHAE
jgi:hypothetical protein